VSVNLSSNVFVSKPVRVRDGFASTSGHSDDIYIYIYIYRERYSYIGIDIDIGIDRFG
jgi:hypothetical protein